MVQEALAVTPRGSFHYDREEPFIGHTLAAGLNWETAHLDTIERWLGGYKNADMTMVDVGAHIGCHSVPYALMFPKAHVHAFEPQDNMLTFLRGNVTLNHLEKRVTVHAAALGHEARTVTLQDTPETHHHGGIQLGTGARQMQMITLDSLALRNVALIKIDVEGAEPLVIYGARDTIRRERPLILAERNAKRITDDMAASLDLPQDIRRFDHRAFLEGINYRLCGRLADDQVFCPAERCSHITFDKWALIHESRRWLVIYGRGQCLELPAVQQVVRDVGPWVIVILLLLAVVLAVVFNRKR